MRARLTDSGPTGVAVVRRIFDLTRVYLWHMITACSFAGITAAISVLIPKFLGQGVDEAFTLFNQGNYESAEIRSMLLNTAGIVLLVAALREIFAPVQEHSDLGLRLERA